MTEHLILSIIQNMMDINVDWLQWSKKFLMKKRKNENKIIPNKEFAEEVRKSFIRKFEKRKVYSSRIDNI